MDLDAGCVRVLPDYKDDLYSYIDSFSKSDTDKVLYEIFSFASFYNKNKVKNQNHTNFNYPIIIAGGFALHFWKTVKNPNYKDIDNFGDIDIAMFDFDNDDNNIFKFWKYVLETNEYYRRCSKKQKQKDCSSSYDKKDNYKKDLNRVLRIEIHEKIGRDIDIVVAPSLQCLRHLYLENGEKYYPPAVQVEECIRNNIIETADLNVCRVGFKIGQLFNTSSSFELNVAAYNLQQARRMLGLCLLRVKDEIGFQLPKDIRLYIVKMTYNVNIISPYDFIGFWLPIFIYGDTFDAKVAYDPSAGYAILNWEQSKDIGTAIVRKQKYESRGYKIVEQPSLLERYASILLH